MNFDKINTNTEIILIYSNFSVKSKQFLEFIKTPTFNLIELLKINELCIDNQLTRNRILKSKLIKITYVPCILIVHSDGGVEQYDHSNAFNWAREILLKYQQLYQQQIQEKELEKQKSEIINEQEEKEEQELDEQTEIVKKQKPKKLKKYKKKVTSIDEDDLSTDDDVKEYKKMKKPPMSLRLDSGNYEEVTLEDDDNEQITSSGIKKSEQGGRVDTMSLAQAMQKERDIDFEKNKPNGMK